MIENKLQNNKDYNSNTRFIVENLVGENHPSIPCSRCLLRREALSTTQMGEMCPACNADMAHVGSIKIIIIKSNK